MSFIKFVLWAVVVSAVGFAGYIYGYLSD